MGFLELIPADNLAATYRPETQTLKLYANGIVQNFTCDVHFHRLKWVGGLKFELQAWVGPHVLGTRDYKWTQAFHIPNLRRVVPSGQLIIVIQNHSTGVFVPIRWLGFGAPEENNDDPLSAGSVESLAKLPTTDEPNSGSIDAEVTNITAHMGRPFVIKEAISQASDVLIDEQHSHFALAILTSGVELGNLFWTFDALKPGTTQVIVTIVHGLGSRPIRKVYDVHVVLLENALVPGGRSSDEKEEAAHPEIFIFRARVAGALKIAQGISPEARPLVVTATLPPGAKGPVVDPLLLTYLDCRFWTKSGTIIIDSPSYGVYTKPVTLKDHLLGVEPFDYADLKLGIRAAAEKVEVPGTWFAFWDVTLSHQVVAPGELPNEPCYDFNMADKSQVFVGATSGEVVVKVAEKQDQAK